MKGVCVFRCNPPPALLAEWPGSFTCHCGNTGVERTPNKSQHTELTLEKKILPPFLPGFEHAAFWSRVQRFYQEAIAIIIIIIALAALWVNSPFSFPRISSCHAAGISAAMPNQNDPQVCSRSQYSFASFACCRRGIRIKRRKGGGVRRFCACAEISFVIDATIRDLDH